MLDELLHLSLSLFIMSNQIYIQFLEWDEFHYALNWEVDAYSGVISFTWTPHPLTLWEKERLVTMHQSNVAYYRTFKECCWPDTNENLIVHYKNDTAHCMMSWKMKVQWDFLICDSDYDITWIPLRNIKYYEVF